MTDEEPVKRPASPAQLAALARAREIKAARERAALLTDDPTAAEVIPSLSTEMSPSQMALDAQRRRDLRLLGVSDLIKIVAATRPTAAKAIGFADALIEAIIASQRETRS